MKEVTNSSEKESKIDKDESEVEQEDESSEKKKSVKVIYKSNKLMVSATGQPLRRSHRTIQRNKTQEDFVTEGETGYDTEEISKLKQTAGIAVDTGKKVRVLQYEVIGVGAGTGGGFKHTTELNVKKYNQVMREKDALGWADAVVKEHNQMLINKVWMPVLRSSVPNIIAISTTWAMKMKANGTLRA